MPNIGPTELIILLVIVLVIFGPKRLPGLGKQLGTGMREFKESVTNKADRDDEEDEAPAAPALPKATEAPAEPAVTAPPATVERAGGDEPSA